jgi:hypothetical protein
MTIRTRSFLSPSHLHALFVLWSSLCACSWVERLPSSLCLLVHVFALRDTQRWLLVHVFALRDPQRVLDYNDGRAG